MTPFSGPDVWTKKILRGSWGEGLGGHAKLFMLGFPPHYLKCCRDRQTA